MLKAMSRSPIIMQEVIALGKQMKAGERHIKEVVTFGEEEVGAEWLEEKAAGFVSQVDAIAKLYKKIIVLQTNFAKIPRTKKPREYRKARWRLARQRINLSRLVRAIEFTVGQQGRLVDTIPVAAKKLESPARQRRQLEAKILKARGNPEKELKKKPVETEGAGHHHGKVHGRNDHRDAPHPADHRGRRHRRRRSPSGI